MAGNGDSDDTRVLQEVNLSPISNVSCRFWFPLQALLDSVVEKSEGYSVEQLERLYSLLSQCIYQHRREYDKTQLLEVSADASFLERGRKLKVTHGFYFFCNYFL